MAKGKKFAYRLVQESSGWVAEITRRKTARETVVSKRQDGFSSEAEAKVWGETELNALVQAVNLRQRQKKEQNN